MDFAERGVCGGAAMAIRFSCACGQKLRTADGTEGKQARCPRCGRWLRIPPVSIYESRSRVVCAKSTAFVVTGILLSLNLPLPGFHSNVGAK